jgi:hypothetical protein
MKSELPFFALITITALLMGSCSPAQAITQIPTATPQAKATSTPMDAPATLTEIPASSTPVPEVRLKGLVTELARFPTITAAQQQEHILKAIETESLFMTPDDIYQIQLSQFTYNDIIFGQGVHLACGVAKACLIRDSYQVALSAGSGEVKVHKLLLELFVTFEDGTQGSVIMPLVIDIDQSFGQGFDAATQRKIDNFDRQQNKNVLSFNFLTKLDKSKTTNPVILALLADIKANPRLQELLTKAHSLAKTGKFLSQDELLELQNAIINF